MKSLLVLALVLSGFAAHANSSAEQNELTSELMETLIVNSATAKLVRSNDEVYSKSLATVLAEAVSAKTLVEVGQEADIRSISSNCQNITPKGLVGSAHFDCQIFINDGTYLKTKTGYKGPSTESSVMLRFKATKAVYPGAKLQLSGDKVYVDFAG